MSTEVFLHFSALLSSVLASFLGKTLNWDGWQLLAAHIALANTIVNKKFTKHLIRWHGIL